MEEHDDISRLCDKKIVATPHSGYEVSMMRDMWLNLDESNKNWLKQEYFKKYGWTLGVFVYKVSQPHTQVANIIIFYVVEYLYLLGLAAEKTSEELLNIYAVVQLNNKVYKDLIKIAFGDINGMGYDPRPLETEEGRYILDIYKSLL